VPRPPRPSPTALVATLLVAVAALAGASCSTTSGGTPVTLSTTTTEVVDPGETTTTTAEPAAGLGTELFVYSPVEGDCIDLRARTADGAATTRALPDPDATPRGSDQLVLRLDCGLPHQYEVLAVVQADLPSGADEQALVTEAKRLCPATFAPAIGRSYESSELEVGWVLPTGDQRRLGDLRIGCLAFDRGGKLEGSVRGTDR